MFVFFFCFLQQDKLIKWQLAHPEKTANEALDWMMQSQAKRAKLEPCAWLYNQQLLNIN